MSDKVAQKTEISIRALASMALFCAGVWLVPSGIALHFASHEGTTMWSHLFMTMHNTASLLFLMAAVAHVILNWKVLTHYVNAKVGEYMRFKRELLIAVLGRCLCCLWHPMPSTFRKGFLCGKPKNADSSHDFGVSSVHRTDLYI